MCGLELLRGDIEKYGLNLEASGWEQLLEVASLKDAPNRGTILNSFGISDSWVFIATGFAASYYTHGDGRQTLTRFFEPGHIAGNVSSTWRAKRANGG